MSFDPQAFLDMAVTESNSTSKMPVPEGDYTAVVKSVKAEQWTKRDDPSVGGLRLDVIWSIDDAAVKQLMDRDEVTVKQGIMLDITEAGGLDMGKGKNVGLGKLRLALDLNNPGQAFSFNQLPGRLAKVAVKHRIDGENIYDEVKAVAKA